MKTSSDTVTSARTTPVSTSSERSEHVGIILDALRSIVRELRLASREAEQRVGVHGAQLHALRQLADAPSMSLTELADRTHTDISSRPKKITIRSSPPPSSIIPTVAKSRST